MSKQRRFISIIGVLSAIGLSAIIPATVVAADSYDLVILNGRVMDPESRLDAVRNIGISDGRIALITAKAIQGAQTIDATNHVVAPGFIDVHSHGQDPFAFKLKLRDGVTTALEIEAGVYPVDDYYKAFQGKAQLNYGASVSHVFARIAVMDGVDPKGLGMYSGAINAAAAHGSHWNTTRADSPADLEKITIAVEEGLNQGALGIGVPIGYYDKVGSSEIFEIYGLAKRYNSFIGTHLRYMSNIEPSGVLALQEALADAMIQDVPLLIHHIHSTSLQRTRQALDMVDAARARGLNVISEAYPYDYGSSIIGADYLGEGFQEAMGMDYSDITYVKTGEKMTKELLARYRKQDPGGMMMLHHMKWSDVTVALQREGVIIGSDGVPYFDENGEIPGWSAPYGAGLGHPRGAGTYASILRLVREQQVFDLMTGISKMSYEPAKWLQDFVPDMKLRGRLKVGAIADITIFDPVSVTDNALPERGKMTLPSTGIPYVIVNGTVVVSDSTVLEGIYPGQPVRNKVRP
ncbi:amidohydrolase family protein [Pseudomonadota bacterium]